MKNLVAIIQVLTLALVVQNQSASHYCVFVSVDTGKMLQMYSKTTFFPICPVAHLIGLVFQAWRKSVIPACHTRIEDKKSDIKELSMPI